MAITKQRKGELVEQYAELLKKSEAVILVDYRGVLTKDVYRLRTRVRESQGDFHVTKNTWIIRALRDAGLPVPEKLLDGPTAISFCFGDPPATAKAVLSFADEIKLMTVKGGLVGNQILDAAGGKALS